MTVAGPSRPGTGWGGRIGRRARFGLSVLAGTVLVLLVGWAVAVTAAELSERTRPPLPLLAATVIVTGLGTFSGGYAWAAVFDRGPVLRLARGFVASQLAKYVPGGIWQPAGQMVMARTAGVSTGEAGNALAVYYSSFLVVAAGGGPLVAVTADGLHPVLRAGLAVLPVSAVALHPSILHRLLRLLPWNRRTSAPALPPGNRLARVMLGQAGLLVANGMALVLVLTWMEVDHAPVAVLAAFAVSWGAGFLAVPIPAGAGVRELVLVALLAPWAASPEVVAAAVVVRLAALVSEVLLTVTLLGVERLGAAAVRRREVVVGGLAAEQVEP